MAFSFSRTSIGGEVVVSRTCRRSVAAFMHAVARAWVDGGAVVVE
jgi:hypothetical protein